MAENRKPQKTRYQGVAYVTGGNSCRGRKAFLVAGFVLPRSQGLPAADKTIRAMTQKEFQGYNGTLILTDTGIVIKRGLKGILLGGGMLRGDKTIPYSRVVAVQLKKAGMTAGYIQLTLMGGSEAKTGLFQSTRDENSINFHAYGNNNALFQEAKEIIEQHIGDSGSGSGRSDINDLEKLASLRDKGVITEQEFAAKKKQILGM